MLGVVVNTFAGLEVPFLACIEPGCWLSETYITSPNSSPGFQLKSFPALSGDFKDGVRDLLHTKHNSALKFQTSQIVSLNLHEPNRISNQMVIKEQTYPDIDLQGQIHHQLLIVKASCCLACMQNIETNKHFVKSTTSKYKLIHKC